MNEIKFPLLTSEDIEVKIKQVTKAGALALLYKTARVDRKILNQVFGPLNWTSDYKVVKDNLYCGIGIRADEDHDFVWKWDCGIESRSDGDGNEKKGEASDAFKRAGFQVGIGEELYSAPFIWLDVATVPDGNKWRLKDPFAKYVVTHIAYNKDTRVITELDIANVKSNIRVFSYRMPTTGAIASKMAETLDKHSTANVKPEKKPVPVEAQKAPKSDDTVAPAQSVAPATKNAAEGSKMPLKKVISSIGKMVKNMLAKDGNINTYNQFILDVTGSNEFRCNKATEEEYDTVFKIYQKLVDGGYNG